MPATGELGISSINSRQPNIGAHASFNDSEDDRVRSNWTIIGKLLLLLNAANHVIVIFLTWFILSYATTASSTMRYHVTFCTIGYILLMSEAILAFTNENIWTSLCSRRTRAHVHWMLQVCGSAFAIAGIVIMYRVKSTHFKSVHAITGIASIAIMILLLVAGYPVLISVRLRKVIRPIILRFMHNFLGIMCFVLGIVSLCYAYKKKWIHQEKSSVSINYISCSVLVLTIISTILTLRSALCSLYNQLTGLFR